MPGVESVTVIVTELVPDALGVPVIWPELAPTVSPAGSPLADQVYGELPPLAETIVAYAEPAAPFRSAVVEITGAGAIVNDRLAEAVR